MVSYIILGLVIGASIIGFIWGCMDDGFLFGLVNWLTTLLVGALVGGLLFIPFMLIPGSVHSTETYNLRASATSNSIDGEFFLGTGYVNGKRTLNFIAEADGANYVNQVYAKDSVIFERDDVEPEVTYSNWGNPWIVPWNYGQTYEFTVPTGSIMGDYEIAND